MATPLTSRKGWMTTANSAVTTGESVDSSERRQLGQGGLAARSAAPMREHPSFATKNPVEKYPQGCPRGGENEHPICTDTQETTLANGQTTMNAVCKCGKVCKNQRGLKIHQTRMGCLRKQVMLRAVSVLVTAPDETQGEQGPESPHSVPDPQAASATTEQRARSWPP